MPLPVIGKIVKMVGGGIGLASESYLVNKEKKELAKLRSNLDLAETASSSGIATASNASGRPNHTLQPNQLGAPPEYIETTPEHAHQLIADGKVVPTDIDDSSEDEDEEEWK